VDRLRVDGENPNKMGVRRFEALKKSIQRYGFVVPIITNRALLVADGEHRLRAAKELGMKQVSVVRLPVDEVDRRLIRQVMNKLRGEHDVFLDAEEYFRIVSEDQRGLLRELLNESDLRIDNLLKLRTPMQVGDAGLAAIAEQFRTRVESNRLDREWKRVGSREPLTLKCHVEFSTRAEVTERTLAVCEAFGLGVDEARRFPVYDGFSLDFQRGDLIFVTGDSGGGKSLLLRAFKEFFGDEAIDLSDLEIDPEETLVEGVGKNVKEAITVLSMVGLNDAFLFLRKFRELSDGQKYRYRLAKLLDCRAKSVWIVDEFCATLDRVMAKIVAYLFQKVARRQGKTVVVGTTHRDIVADFQPDVLVEKGFEREVKVTRSDFVPKKCSICEGVRVETGSVEDYAPLRRFHYRSEEAGKSESLRVRECFRLLFEDALIGVIVYSRSYLNLKPRNMVFGDRYVFTPGDLQKAQLINVEIARISRVVLHPKFRGIGLGAYLVKATLPRVGVKVVEALAVMAMYNPFFEKAGMVKVDYKRDGISIERKMRRFLEDLNFDFDLVGSKTYCRQFYLHLNDNDRKRLLGYLTEFARQPFVKMKTITPELLAKAFSSNGVYLYWVNASLD
jgi:ABC-type transport system involved in cytochrome c biogenesis ATPase subunit/GNAT superfamily N-acetyltransferase